MKKSLCILLSLISMGYAGNPTASDLIQNYQQVMKKIESVSYDYHLLCKQHDSAIPSPQIVKREVKVKTDGNRVDHRARIWANYADRNNPDIESVVPRERSFLWDGDSLYTYRWMSEKGNTNSQAFIEPNDKEKQAHLAIDDASSPLRGVMGGDFDRIDSILYNSDSLKVLNKKKKVGASECYVLQANGKYGKYKVWLDPEHGYHIAKARVFKKQDDIAWRNMPLGPRMAENERRKSSGGQHPGLKESFSFVLEDVKFEKISGIWCPVAGKYQCKIKHVSGRIVTVESSLNCDNIVIDPKYDETDFRPDNIADGTLVAIVPRQEKYTWQDGKVVDDSDKVVLDAIPDEK
jgi:hypothetical protein